jgi:hypothetical protein
MAAVLTDRGYGLRAEGGGVSLPTIEELRGCGRTDSGAARAPPQPRVAGRQWAGSEGMELPKGQRCRRSTSRVRRTHHTGDHDTR